MTNGEDPRQAIKRDYTLDVLKLLANLRQEIEEARGFGVLTLGFRRDDLVMKIEKIRASMPRDIRDAENLTRDRQRMLDDADAEAKMLVEQAQKSADEIVASARRESDRIRQEARIEQERLIDESEVLKIATEQAEAMKASVTRECRDMRRQVDDYIFQALRKLETQVNKIQDSVEASRRQMEELQRQGPSGEPDDDE
ncbi:MAG: hypothetical protein MH204_06865 [Fimbriimonadaceae bacterium]|nr:hypothetical protein [Fimbriimonadaceae bacterium]